VSVDSDYVPRRPEEVARVDLRNLFATESVVGTDERRLGDPNWKRIEDRLERVVPPLAIAREHQHSSFVRSRRLLGERLDESDDIDVHAFGLVPRE